MQGQCRVPKKEPNVLKSHTKAGSCVPIGSLGNTVRTDVNREAVKTRGSSLTVGIGVRIPTRVEAFSARMETGA